MQDLLPKKQLKETVNRLGWTLVIMLGVMSVIATVSIAVAAVLEIFKGNGWMDYRVALAVTAVVDTVSYLSFFIVPALLFYVISKKHPVRPVKFRISLSKYLPLMILSGVAVIQLAGMVNGWFESLVGYEGLPSQPQQYMSDAETVIMFMTVSLAPAFAEEVLFRGVVYTNLRPYGKTFAVLGSSLLFALMHQNIGQLFYTLVAGIVMALIYEATGSIWGGVFLHMFNNLYAVLQEAVICRYDETTAIVILTLAQSVIVLLGAVSTVALIFIQKKNICHTEKSKREGVFASEITTDASQTVSWQDAALSFVKAPGMLVFIILAVLST